MIDSSGMHQEKEQQPSVIKKRNGIRRQGRSPVIIIASSLCIGYARTAGTQGR